LVERFPALTPFSIRREKAREVFLLLERLQEHSEREYIQNGGRKGDKVVVRNGERVIFRPAGRNSKI
jgi:hypothetical protein